MPGGTAFVLTQKSSLLVAASTAPAIGDIANRASISLSEQQETTVCWRYTAVDFYPVSIKLTGERQASRRFMMGVKRELRGISTPALPGVAVAHVWRFSAVDSACWEKIPAIKDRHALAFIVRHFTSLAVRRNHRAYLRFLFGRKRRSRLWPLPDEKRHFSAEQGWQLSK